MKILLTLIVLLLFSFNIHAGNVGKSSELAVAQAGTSIVPINRFRRSVLLVNTSSADTITVKLDSIPTDIDDGFKLRGNQNESVILPVTNQIFGISSNAGGSNIEIFEILE